MAIYSYLFDAHIQSMNLSDYYCITTFTSKVQFESPSCVCVLPMTDRQSNKPHNNTIVTLLSVFVNELLECVIYFKQISCQNTITNVCIALRILITKPQRFIQYKVLNYTGNLYN